MRDTLYNCIEESVAAPSPDDIVSELGVQLPRSRRLYADYVANWTPNAIAKVDGHLYLVGIWVGIPFIIMNLFMTLMCHPKLFPDVGRVDADEWDDTFSYSSILSTCQRLRVDSDRRPMLFCDPFPRNQERQCFAMILAIMAIRFVATHERMHVYRGHLDYLRDKTGQQHIDEFALPLIGGIPMTIRRAFEIDADITSALTVGNYMRMIAR